MKIELNVHPDPGGLKQLIKQYRYGRWIEDNEVPAPTARTFILDQLNQTLARAVAEHIAIYDDSNRLAGLLLFHPSEWDSSFFGFPVAIIDGCYLLEQDYPTTHAVAEQMLKRFDEWCRQKNIRFVVAKAPSLDLPLVNAYEKDGYNFIEAYAYNKFNLNRGKVLPPPTIELRLAIPSDREPMLQYSKGAFASQRFHADHHIDKVQADLLYRKWIETAFDDPKKYILVHEEDGKPVAFLICYEDTSCAALGLNVVVWTMSLLAPSVRGRGLGGEFYNAIFNYHQKNGVDVVDSGVTLRNIISMNLCNRIGFRITTVTLTFHKWFDR